MCPSDARGARGVLALVLIATGLAACATPGGAPRAVADLGSAERPVGHSDEAGMWMQMDREEVRLRTSATLVRDPALREYVRGVVCRIAGSHCQSIRVYVVRNPEFRGSMAANGMLQVSTGLLLRVANEAQLAYVLGHEIGHYLRRHALQRWEDLKAKWTNWPAEQASISAFSREHEREADQIGCQLMLSAGYDPREAPRVWERLLAEPPPPRNATRDPYLATHPTNAERAASLRACAEQAAAMTPVPRVGGEEYRAQLRPIRGALLHDEVRRRRFPSSEALLRHLIEEGEGLGELHFHVGEIHRLRGEREDLPKAVEAYRRALEFPDAPAEALRSLGTAHARQGDRGAARDALLRYLERKPDAEDRDVIRNQIVDLEAPR